MRSVARTAGALFTAPTGIICLPGAYAAAEDFLLAGFDARVRNRDLPIDLLFVDVEMQHLGDRRFREQLKHEIVDPARASGCRSLWFAGVSLGGFWALDYAASYPGDLAGLCLLAPYLGTRIITSEIARAHGLAEWVPGALAEHDEERRIWHFIKTQREVPDLRMYLGYGREDRFAQAHALMAKGMPAGTVQIVAGGHDWRTWTLLWEHFLDSRFA